MISPLFILMVIKQCLKQYYQINVKVSDSKDIRDEKQIEMMSNFKGGDQENKTTKINKDAREEDKGKVKKEILLSQIVTANHKKVV